MINKNIYLMSDLHGHYNLFLQMLEKIEFTKEDELFILGDIIDRGSQSLELIRYIMEHSENIHLLKGNHESMMVDASKENFWSICYDTHLWFSNGGFETFKQLRSLKDNEVNEIIGFFDKLPLYVKIELDKTYILSHSVIWSNSEGGINPKTILWHRPTTKELEVSTKRNKEDITYIFGHTPTQHFRPQEVSKFFKKGKYIDIDCSLAYNNKFSQLGCLNLKNMEEFYIPLFEEKKEKV